MKKYFLQRIPTLAWMTYIKLIQVTSTSRYHKNQQKNPWTPLMFLGSINMFLYGSGAFLYPRLMGRSCPTSRRLPTSWMFSNPQALLVVSQLTWTISPYKKWEEDKLGFNSSKILLRYMGRLILFWWWFKQPKDGDFAHRNGELRSPTWSILDLRSGLPSGYD